MGEVRCHVGHSQCGRMPERDLVETTDHLSLKIPMSSCETPNYFLSEMGPVIVYALSTGPSA